MRNNKIDDSIHLPLLGDRFQLQEKPSLLFADIALFSHQSLAESIMRQMHFSCRTCDSPSTANGYVSSSQVPSSSPTRGKPRLRFSSCRWNVVDKHHQRYYDSQKYPETEWLAKDLWAIFLKMASRVRLIEDGTDCQGRKIFTGYVPARSRRL